MRKEDKPMITILIICLIAYAVLATLALVAMGRAASRRPPRKGEER